MAEGDDIALRSEQWARQFGGTATNLRQRQRYARDIAKGESIRAGRAEAANESLLRTDKGARDLAFGRERLRMAEDAALQRQENFEVSQERLLDRDAFAQEMQLKKASLDALNSQRMMQKELRDAGNAERILQDTIKAERDIDDNIFGGVLPGTKEFADIALRTIARFPMMDPKARASILSSAKILGDEEEFDTAWNKLTPEQKARATVSDDPKGWRISVAAPKSQSPDQQLDDLRRQYAEASTKRAALEGEKGALKAGFSEDDRLFFDDEKRRIMGLIRGISPTAAGPASSTATPEPVVAPAAPPASGGNLVPRRTSSGEVWLFDADTKQPVRRQ